MKDVKSMKNTEIAEKVKSAIIKYLFSDVDTQKCAIDIFLQNPKAFEKTANILNKESISFLNKCQQQLKAESDNFDTTHPLYGKVCVFTGKLELMSREQAAQLVVNLGGTCGNGVTKKTNYLILGNNDYCSTIKDGKSSKQKKAEQLILSGQDLQIIPEDVFYELVLENVSEH